MAQTIPINTASMITRAPGRFHANGLDFSQLRLESGYTFASDTFSFHYFYRGISVMMSADHDIAQNTWTLVMSIAEETSNPASLSDDEIDGLLFEAGFEERLPITVYNEYSNYCDTRYWCQILPEEPMLGPVPPAGAKGNIYRACLLHDKNALQKAAGWKGESTPFALEVQMHRILARLPYAEGSERVESTVWLHKHGFCLGE